MTERSWFCQTVDTCEWLITLFAVCRAVTSSPTLPLLPLLYSPTYRRRYNAFVSLQPLAAPSQSPASSHQSPNTSYDHQPHPHRLLCSQADTPTTTTHTITTTTTRHTTITAHNPVQAPPV